MSRFGAIPVEDKPRQSRFGAIPVEDQPRQSRFGAIPVEEQPTPEAVLPAEVPVSPAAAAPPGLVPTDRADRPASRRSRMVERRQPKVEPEFPEHLLADVFRATDGPAVQPPDLSQVMRIADESGGPAPGYPQTDERYLNPKEADIPYIANVLGLLPESLAHVGGDLAHAVGRAHTFTPGAKQAFDTAGGFLRGFSGPASPGNMEETMSAVDERDFPRALKSLPAAVPEVIAVSLPHMLMIKKALPAYMGALTERVNSERIENGGEDDLEGYTRSAAVAVASGLLDRYGLEKILRPWAMGGVTALAPLMRAIGVGALSEAVTEALQEFLEYLGTTFKTNKEMTAHDAITHVAGGFLLGGASGGTLAGAGAAANTVAEVARDRMRNEQLSAHAGNRALDGMDPSLAALQEEIGSIREQAQQNAPPAQQMNEADLAITGQPVVVPESSDQGAAEPPVASSPPPVGEVTAPPDSAATDVEAAFDPVSIADTMVTKRRADLQAAEGTEVLPAVMEAQLSDLRQGFIDGANGATAPEGASHEYQLAYQTGVRRARQAGYAPSSELQPAPAPDAEASTLRRGDPDSAATDVQSGRNEQYGSDVEMRREGESVTVSESGYGYPVTSTYSSGLGGVYMRSSVTMEDGRSTRNDYVLNMEGDFVKPEEINHTNSETDPAKRPFKGTPEQKQAAVDLAGRLAFARSVGDTALAERLSEELYNLVSGTAQGQQQAAPVSASQPAPAPQAAAKTKPARKRIPIGKPKTGAPLTGVGYRVQGIEPSRLYSGVQAPILGEGQYSAFTPEGATFFGGEGSTPTETEVELKNPLVLRSDEDWRGITKEAGWRFPNPSGLSEQETVDAIAALRRLIESRGHDGVVVAWNDAERGDVDANGRGIKLLRDVFGQPQVVAFAKPQEVIGERLEDSAGEPVQEGRVRSDDGKLADNRIPKGGLSPKTTEVSFTNRTSLYRLAFEAAGEDPDLMTLAPAKRQVRVLSELFKNQFGINVMQDKGALTRESIDQLLDGYRNILFMMNVLGLPAHAVGLGGDLNLMLEKFKGRYLGAYSPAHKAIFMPGRSNSFAHEWFHALDHYLVRQLEPAAREALLSDQARKKGLDPIPGSVQEAFVALLNNVFYANPEVHGLDPKKAADLIAKIMRGEAVHAPRAMPESEFAKSSASYGDRGYWASPAEMLARAFEAYVAYKIEAESISYSSNRGSNEFITKGDRAYLDQADERLKKTFPHSNDRMRIFDSFDHLFDRIRAEELLGKGVRAEKPSDLTRFTPADYTAPDRNDLGLLQSEIRAAQEMKDWLMTWRQRTKEMPPSQKLSHMITGMNRFMFWSMRSRFRRAIRMAPPEARKHLRALMRDIIDDPGTGAWSPETAERAAQSMHNMKMNKLASIISKHDLAQYLYARDPAKRKRYQQMLTLALTADGKISADAAFIKAAADIRNTILDPEWYANQAAGINLGYTPNGHLQRIVDRNQVMHWQDPKGRGFTSYAAEAYGVLFDKDVPTELDMKAYRQLNSFVRTLSPNGRAAVQAQMQALRKFTRKLNKLEKELSAAQHAGDAKKAGELRQKIRDLLVESRDAWLEARDAVRKVWAHEAATDWETRILIGDDIQYDVLGPDSSYTRKRTLPPEADRILVDFYIQDPIERIHRYLSASSRRIAYESRRFRKDARGNRVDKWTELVDAAYKAGTPPDVINEVKHIVAKMTLSQTSGLSTDVDGFLHAIMTLFTMTILPRAWMTSLPEPIISMGASRDLTAPFKMLTNMMGGAFNTKDATHRKMIAETIGLISAQPVYDTLNMNRLSYQYTSGKWHGIAASYFNRTLLTPLTMAQRKATVGIGHAYARMLASEIVEKGNQAAQARAEFNEFGIPPELHQDFAEWIMQHERMPNIQELETDAGKMYGLFIRRFSQRVIMDPPRASRPEAAFDARWRFMYGITAYTQDFYENVTKRMVKQIDRDTKLGMPTGGAKALAVTSSAVLLVTQLASLYMGQFLHTVVREFIFNHDEWEEQRKKGNLEAWLAEKSFWRTGLLGSFDIVANTFRGMIFQRDFSSILAGAQFGQLLTGISMMITPFTGYNNEKSNTAEHNALRALFSTIISPAMVYALSAMPAGRITAPIAGAAIMAVTSPDTSRAFADAIVGEKDSSAKARAKKRAQKARQNRQTTL